MKPACPKCRRQLPQKEALEYRFCPHCGTEMNAGPKNLEDALLTLPPDPPSGSHQMIQRGLSSQALRKIAPGEHFNDRAIEPREMIGRSRPKIKPPAVPPPPGFFRNHSGKKPDLPAGTKKQQLLARHRKKVVIGALVLLAVIILIIGGLFTF